MKFMILLKADKNIEAGALPDEKLLAAMGKYNEELLKAGVLLAAEGLQPSAFLRFYPKNPKAGDEFVRSRKWPVGYRTLGAGEFDSCPLEAIDWVKRCPNPMGDEAEIGIRQIFESADFGEALTPELRQPRNG